MAFGKSGTGLAGVTAFGGQPSFSQRTAQLFKNQQSTRQSRGGGGNLFGDRFSPTKEPNKLDEGRLLRGEYLYTGCDGQKNTYETKLEYWPYITHFDGRNERSTICSAGVFNAFKDARDPCHGCDMFWSTRETGPNGKKRSRVSKSDRYAFNFLHYHPYHKIPQIDRGTGAVKTNDQGEPYFEWVQCDGRLCEMCKQNIEKAPARSLKWEMGVSHFLALTKEYNALIAKTCKGCGARDSITCLAYTCSTCGEAVIDMSDTTLTDENIEEIKNDPVVCSHCKVQGWLNEVYRCSSCNLAERSDIFDVDIQVRRIETSGSDGGKQTQLIVAAWSTPHPLDPGLSEYVKIFDLPKVYQPSDMEYQARQFSLPSGQAGAAVQRTPATANAGFRGYQKSQDPNYK